MSALQSARALDGDGGRREHDWRALLGMILSGSAKMPLSFRCQSCVLPSCVRAFLCACGWVGVLGVNPRGFLSLNTSIHTRKERQREAIPCIRSSTFTGDHNDVCQEEGRRKMDWSSKNDPLEMMVAAFFLFFLQSTRQKDLQQCLFC